MLCKKCHKKAATVRYTEVANGQTVEWPVCSSCLSQLQADGASGFSLAGIAPTERKPAPERVAREVMHAPHTCPVCRTTLSTVLEEGKVGCMRCYTHFGSEVESVLEGLHPALIHKGKTARVDDIRARIQADLQMKRVLLRSVLEAENYEEAARLRDEMRSLETGLHISESGAD